MAFVPIIPATSFIGTGNLTRQTTCPSRHVHQRARVVRPVAVTTPPPTESASALAEKLASKLVNTNRGLRIAPGDRDQIEDTMAALNKIGSQQIALRSPHLFGKYNVAYTSTRNKSPPAGGLYRTRIGRLIFISRGIFQHLFAPDTAVNLVCFRVLGVLKGCVGLRGKITPLEDDSMGPNTVGILFERPRIQFGDAVFQFGPRSQVKLALTYVDENIRLGVGGSGSCFVFTRGGEADLPMADEWNYLFQAKPLPVVILPVTLALFLALAFFTPPLVRIIALIIACGAWYVLKRGGIANDGISAIAD